MKTKFYLRKNSKGFSINFEIKTVEEKLRISTGYIIKNEKDWDLKRERVKLPSSCIEGVLINKKINEFNDKVSIIFLENKNDSVFESVKLIFCDIFERQLKTNNSEIETKTYDLIGYYEEFLRTITDKISLETNKNYSPGAIKNFRNALNRLKDFLKHKKYSSMDFKDFDKTFYSEFIQFMNERNYTKNYIGSCLQKIKTIMNNAFEEKIHDITDYRFNKSFKKISESIDLPYLNEYEIKCIENVETFTDREKRAKEIFLIGCYTGLRIGDLLSYLKNPSQLIDNNGIQFIKINQSKTNEEVLIPITPKIKSILTINNNSFPKYLSHAKINKLIKVISERAGINQVYEFHRTKNGKKEIVSKPKYELISTHTARRSFCTNLYLKQMPIQDIMVLSGHKSEAIFKNYIKVDKLENITRVSKNLINLLN